MSSYTQEWGEERERRTEIGERGVSGKGREKGEWKKGRNVINSFTGWCMTRGLTHPHTAF